MKIIKLASMDVMISGYSFPKEADDILTITSRIINDFYDILTDDEKSKCGFLRRRISEDGGQNVFGKKGIINFYSSFVSEYRIDTVLKALKYLFEEYGGTVNKISGPERAGQKNEVYRFHIEINDNPNKNVPPNLNLSNRNAEIIFEGVLNFNIEDRMDIWQVLERIKKVTGHQVGEFTSEISEEKVPNGPTVIESEVTSEYVLGRLNQIKQICEWGLKNGYSKIYVA